MRLSTGVSSRMPRVAPTEALVYKEHVIPPGVRATFPRTTRTRPLIITQTESLQFKPRLHSYGSQHLSQPS